MAVSDRRAEMLANRLRKTVRHRRKWARRNGVSCYRLYDRDIPEVQLTVDWYDGRVCVWVWAEDAESMVATVGPTLGVDDVFVKRRERQRGASQYERLGRRSERVVVHEGGLRFGVNLTDYLDTGLFLDHRQTRAMVRDDASGRRMLNLFAYTGSFSVYAAAGGAAETCTVDMSRTYVDWARDNFELNEMSAAAHRLEREDVLAWLSSVGDAAFDLVVVDPPTFSNSKRMDGTWEIGRDHGALLAEVLRVTAPDGIIYFSCNARRFSLGEVPGATVEEITARTVPPDFAQRRPHRCWRLSK